MKTIRYICTHCGRRFEAEERENLECPGCYWSTTVKKDEPGEASSEPLTERPGLSESGKTGAPRLPWNMLLKSLLGAAVLGAIAWAAWLAYQKWMPSGRKGWVIEKVEMEKDEKKPLQEAAASRAASLTEDDKNLLSRRVQVSAERSPDAEEIKFLQYRAAFQTRIVERLPSQAWTVDQFKQLIAEQERLFKVPLPGSYKRKLENGFKEKYVPAQAAFEAGELLEARNLWVESLIFPIYANDIRKHRGVILTMLRPFINDTLSKIGAINYSLGERNMRDLERTISGQYENLFALAEKQSWPEALKLIEELESSVKLLESQAGAPSVVPPYPPSAAMVDQDIRSTLTDLLSPGDAGMADIQPMKQDLFDKKRVIQSFMPQYLEKMLQPYDRALILIQENKWAEAAAELRQVTAPPEVRKDAGEKIKILKRLGDTALDSRLKTG